MNKEKLNQLFQEIKDEIFYNATDDQYNKFIPIIQQVQNDICNSIESQSEEDKKLKQLFVKYGLDIDCNEEELLDTILKQNKYLKLAYYLQKNRGDWSNGCHYAVVGLEDFNIDNKLDQKIYDNISHYIYNWGNYMDGRCFRDCKYNYSILFDLVEEQDPGIYEDFQFVLGVLRDNFILRGDITI